MGQGRTAAVRRRLAVLGAATMVLVSGGAVPSSGAATPPPAFFAARVEGSALRVSADATATNVNPSPAYSFAQIGSTADLSGERSLQMKATGTTNDPGDLGGAALFTPDSPTRGTADFPNFSEAFFPAFEELGQSEVSEKCAFNNESREEEACRDQPGPYALARVVPDAASPHALGEGRNAGERSNAETWSIAEVRTDDTGAIIASQRNEGRDLSVPDTPIRVRSFTAMSEVIATPDGVEATGECSARVTVGGQEIDSNEALQAALGPFAASGMVEYLPPTEAEVTETFGGTKEVRCHGPRFRVTASETGVAATYTYGQTFATASKPSESAAEPEVDGVLGDGFGDIGLDTGPPPAPASPGPTGTGVSPGPSPALEPRPDTGDDTELTAPPQAQQPPSGPGLVEQRIDTLPLAAATATAAAALPIGAWLLVGVVGSLARGATTLQLPGIGSRRSPGAG